MDCSIADFLSRTLSDTRRGWGISTFGSNTNLEVPPDLLGEHQELFKGDINALWAQWFVQSICGNDIAQKRLAGYGELIAEIRRHASAVLTDAPNNVINGLVKTAAKLVTSGAVGGERESRTSHSRTTKEILLDRFREVPRCYLCGHQFTSGHVDHFLGAGNSPNEYLAFVDFLTPKGLNPRDLAIEVEHVVPHSRGGTDEYENLRLACGWCNSRKQSLQLCYEAPPFGGTMNHPVFGPLSLPHSFWILRILGFGNGCSHPGCDRNSSNSELQITRRVSIRKLNPLCLTVRCEEHDPITTTDRLVPRGLFLPATR